MNAQSMGGLTVTLASEHIDQSVLEFRFGAVLVEGMETRLPGAVAVAGFGAYSQFLFKRQSVQSALEECLVREMQVIKLVFE